MIPKYLYVSGAPLLLSGFNGKYTFCGTENEPRWSLGTHSHFGILIRPTMIKVDENNSWVLCSDDFCNEKFDSIVNDSFSLGKLPLGKWSQWAFVSKENTPVQNFFRSYGQSVAIIGCIAYFALKFGFSFDAPISVGHVIAFLCGMTANFLLS